MSTDAGDAKPYSEAIMRGAFVVQLRKAGEHRPSRLEGLVEEVDTGKQSHFRSEDELLAFLRERFAESRQAVPEEGTE